MSLTARQVAAVREFSATWPDVQADIIGATALGFYYDMSWRKTSDVDLVVALELEEFPGALLDQPGWKQHRHREHEFTSPGGARLDLLPAGPELITAGRIRWPSGEVMSLAGMNLAFDHAEAHTVAGSHAVLVAPPAVVVALKMASYCDRPARRERDLEDIAHLLDAYVDEDDDRRWDEAPDQEFELAPAHLLGVDVGRIARADHHRALIDRFLAKVSDPDSPAHALMHRRGPRHWRNAENLTRRLAAFAAGLAAAGTRDTSAAGRDRDKKT